MHVPGRGGLRSRLACCECSRLRSSITPLGLLSAPVQLFGASLLDAVGSTKAVVRSFLKAHIVHVEHNFVQLF